MENVKMPWEAGLLCTIDEETFNLFTESMLIEDSCAICYITNGNTNLFNVTKIYELVQGSVGSILCSKKGKFHINLCQVDGNEWVHTLWPMKFFPKAFANLFFVTCKFSQGNKIKSDDKNNIVVHWSKGNIILDCCVKTHHGWVARVKFLSWRDWISQYLHKEECKQPTHWVRSSFWSHYPCHC